MCGWLRGRETYAVVLSADNSAERKAHDEKDHNEHAEDDVYLDVFEQSHCEHVHRPEDEHRQTTEHSVCEVRAVVVTYHAALDCNAIHCTAACGHAARARGSEHVHGEEAVADVSLEGRRGGIRHDVLAITEGVNHGLSRGFCVDKAAAVGAACVEHEHRVVDPGSGKDSQVD